MQFPDNCRYTKDHEWIRLEGDSAVMGITEFAQSELGDVVFVDLPAPGKALKQGETACVVESTKAASDVYAPASGTVKEVNKALSDQPQLVNSSSYDKGWMVKFEKVNKDEINKLMSSADYKKLLGSKAV